MQENVDIEFLCPLFRGTWEMQGIYPCELSFFIYEED